MTACVPGQFPATALGRLAAADWLKRSNKHTHRRRAIAPMKRAAEGKSEMEKEKIEKLQAVISGAIVSAVNLAAGEGVGQALLAATQIKLRPRRPASKAQAPKPAKA